MSGIAFSVCKPDAVIQRDKIIKSIIIFFCISFFLCFQGKVLAGACTIERSFQNESVSFGVVNVSGSLPIGSIIKEVRTTAPGVKLGDCDGYYYYGSDMNYSTNTTNINNVYKTNLEGVGIKVTGLYSNNIPSYDPYSSPNSRTTFFYNAPIIAQLIKTGPITPGSLNNGKLVSFKWAGSHGGTFYPVIVYINGMNKINVSACTINNNGMVNVNMNTVKKSEFGAVGSTAGKTKFDIGLYCEKDALIQVSFSPPAEGSPDSNNGMINIRKQANGAEGIGIQLLYDDNTPVIFNSKKTVASYAAAGNVNIPLISQYYKQKATVTGGKADGYVTFTITHQ